MQDLTVITRCYDLLKWLLPKAEQFPKAYRHNLTQHIMQRAMDLQDCLIAAQTLRGAQRLKALQTADVRLQQLKTYLRLIHHWRWLSDGQYQHISRLSEGIGQLLGGWLKQTSRAN